MTVSLKHKFASVKSEGADATKVRTSNWNDEHDLTLATDKLLGRATAGAGAVEEITCTAAGRTLLDDADAPAQRTTLGAAALGANTFTGEQNFADQLCTRPEIKDYAVTYVDKGTQTTGTQTFDLTAGNYQRMQVGGALTIAFSNPPGTGKSGGLIMELVNGGSATVTWPGSGTLKWKSGVAPTLTASGTDFLVFVTRDGGTTWHGILCSLDSK
jgi:hypothetical protein